MHRRVCRVSSALALALLAACASPPLHIPANATIGSTLGHVPEPPTLPSDAPPQLRSMQFSSLDVKRGEHWSGTFVTSTNVASLEVRTPLFSINVPRTSFGRFTFTVNVLDALPVFVRAYRLEVIARNSAGAQAVEELPFRIR